MEIQKWQTLQDGLDGLARATAPMPAVPLPEDHVLVKIHTVSLNYRDTEVCMGLYSHHRSVAVGGPEPLVPCSDMCGTVVAVGSALEIPFKVGDRVVSVFNHLQRSGHMRPEYIKSAGLGLPLEGVLQTHRVFPTIGLLPAPAYLSDAEACCLPIAAVTAWMSLQIGEAGLNYKPQTFEERLKGKTVVAQGTGGVSISGVQIAKAAGATVIVTSSSDAKLETARTQLGADHLINYKTTPQWADEVMAATDGYGADFILENGGNGTLRQSFDAVTFGGVINCIGYLGGKTTKGQDEEDHAVSVLALRRNMTLRGIMNGPRDRFEEMLQFYERHEIKPVVHRVFPFSESPAALQYLYSGQHFGKVVIQVDL